MSKKVILTNSLIEKGGTSCIGFSNYQIKLLGETPTKGWKKRLIGKEISKDLIDQFISLKGISSKQAEKKIKLLDQFDIKLDTNIKQLTNNEDKKIHNLPNINQLKLKERKRIRTKIKRQQQLIQRYNNILRYGVSKSAEKLIKLKGDKLFWKDLNFVNSIVQNHVELLSDKDIKKMTRLFYDNGLYFKELDGKFDIFIKTGKVELRRESKVYVIQSSCGLYTKIGISKDPSNRLKSIQTGNPLQLSLVREYIVYRKGRTAKVIENRLHKTFSKYREKGEWFLNLSVEEIDQALPDDVEINIY